MPRNVKVCKNGHHYDYDKYQDNCPHCAREQGEMEAQKIEVNEIEEKKELQEQSKSKNSQLFNFFQRKKEETDPVTRELKGGVRPEKFDEVKEEKLETKKEDSSKSKIVIGGAVEEVEKDEIHNDKNSQASGDLEAQIRGFESSEPKTRGIWGDAKGEEPPVGWLVCVQGASQGFAYELCAGKNTIGRNMKMDVCVMGDDTISNKHTVIKYEPIKRNMKLLPSDGDGLVYVNDEDIDEVTVLKDRDILQIGKTKLMLVCLCRDDFSWEDWINEGEMP